MVKVHANVTGLTVEEVIALVDKIDVLLSVDFDSMDVAATKAWKKDSAELLKANHNNFIRVNNSIATITDALAHLADSCVQALEETTEPLTQEELNELLADSVEAAREAGVAEEKILKSDEEIKTFMTETKEEEKVVEKEQEFNQEELMLSLIASGVDPEVARLTAANVAKQKTEVKPVEKKKEENTVGNPKPWFKKAVDNLSLPRKVAFIGELTIQQIDAKDKAESDEIQKEIDRLKSDKGDDRFEVLMNSYIIPTKKWTITESGKIAEFAYLTGDGVQKGVAGITRGMGKATKWTGDKIAKGGEKIENNAEKVGKVAAKPFHAAGKGIDKMSTKKEGK